MTHFSLLSCTFLYTFLVWLNRFLLSIKQKNLCYRIKEFMKKLETVGKPTDLASNNQCLNSVGKINAGFAYGTS